jgi:hypothetical protein
MRVETRREVQPETILASLQSLEAWIERSGYASVDWWDLWSTKAGGMAKALYHRSPLLGVAAVAPFMMIDLTLPGVRKLFAQKRVYPICVAHMGLGYLNMFHQTGREIYLAKARQMVDLLLDLACPIAPGLGWGMKHDWMTVKGLVPIDTPCHTQTAYGYWLIRKLLDETNDAKYQELLLRIARHEAHDFPEWEEGDALVSSYSTLDNRHVVNANSYRMAILIDAGRRFNDQEFTDKGLATARWVLGMQKPDGSWPYADDEPFVDCYHTCFVLKNLLEAWPLAEHLKRKIDSAFQKGIAYYLNNLFDRDGIPIPFAVAPRMVFYKYDSYDIAESISLLAALPEETDRMVALVKFAVGEMQSNEGWFQFRKFSPEISRGMPYMRYANSAMFLALTKVLLLSTERSLQ